MTTSQNAYKFGANATGMNTGKNQQKFLSLEKQRRYQNTVIKKLAVDDKGITDETHILEDITEFYGTILRKTETKNCNINGNFFQ